MACPNLENCNLLNNGYNDAVNAVAGLQETLSGFPQEKLPPEMNESITTMQQTSGSPVAMAEQFILAQDPRGLCFSCPIRVLQQAIRQGR